MPRSRRPTQKAVESDAATQESRARSQARSRARSRAPRQSQVPTASPSPDPGPLTVLAQAAALAPAAELQVRDSQQPDAPGPGPGLFEDADSFLRDLSPINEREPAEPAEPAYSPPLPLRPSPKVNRFTDIARGIVGLPSVEDDSEEERPEVHFLAAAFIGKEKTPCSSKMISNIWNFRLYTWEKDVIAAAAPKWLGKGLTIGKESMTVTVSAKNIKPFVLTVCERVDWQGAIDEVDKLNAKGATSIRVELRLQLEASDPPNEEDRLTSSDSEWAFFQSARRRSKAPASSKKSGNGNSKIEKQLALERYHRQMDRADLNHVSKLMELHECIAGSCNNNSLPCVKIDDEHVKLNHDEVGAWSRAINKGKATMEKPHAQLQAQIEATAAAQVKARKAGKQKKQRKGRSDEDSESSYTRKRRRRRRRSRSRDRGPIIVNIPAQQYYPVPPAAVQQNSRPISRAGAAPQSSPIRTAVSANILMERYINWLKQQKQEKSQKYEEGMRLMLEQDVEVPHLLRNRGGVSRAQLQGLGMTMGIAIDVKEGAKIFRTLHPGLFDDSPESGDTSQPNSPSNR